MLNNCPLCTCLLPINLLHIEHLYVDRKTHGELLQWMKSDNSDMTNHDNAGVTDAVNGLRMLC